MMTTADTIIAAEHHPASVEIAATARRNRLSPIRVVTTELWPDMLFSLPSIYKNRRRPEAQPDRYYFSSASSTASVISKSACPSGTSETNFL